MSARRFYLPATATQLQRIIEPVEVDDWRDLAACREVDPEIFYPEKGRCSANPARLVCSGCPVLSQCRRWALDSGEQWGVWGGLTERERRKLPRGGWSAGDEAV